jgi:hypothetical protein
MIFSSPYTVSIHLFPSPSKLGFGQAAVLGRLSLTVCLCGVQKENNGKGKQIRLCKLFVNV